MLEVLISFALITLCAVPLIYPHISMIKSQNQFINKMKINHSVNLIYVNILEKMHKNEILLNDVEEKKIFNVEPEDLKDIVGYKATYQFITEKHKRRNSSGQTVCLTTLQLQFIPKVTGKTLIYDYEVFFISKKDVSPGPNATDEAGVDDEEYEV